MNINLTSSSILNRCKHSPDAVCQRNTAVVAGCDGRGVVLMLIPVLVPELDSPCNCYHWPCLVLTNLNQCAKYQAPIHRMCQSQGKTTYGWSHYGKTVLYFSSRHPDATVLPVNENIAATKQSAVSATWGAVPPRTQNKGGRQTGTTNDWFWSFFRRSCCCLCSQRISWQAKLHR